jgi:hypothetical protein
MSPEAHPPKPSTDPFSIYTESIPTLQVIAGNIRDLPIAGVGTLLRDRYDFDPHLAEAFSADYNQEFATGLPATDNVASKRFDEGRRFIATCMVDDYAALLGEKYIDGRLVSQVPEDPSLAMAVAARRGDKQLESHFQTSLGKRWLQETEGIADLGLARSQIVSTMYDVITLGFRPEAEWNDGRLVHDIVPQSDIQYVYGDETPPLDLTANEFSLRLREIGISNPTKEKLDAQFSRMIDAINIDYCYLALRELRQMASLGRDKEQRAKELFEAHRHTLTGLDVTAKAQVMKQISDTYKKFAFYARGGRYTKTVKAFELMSDRAQSVNSTLGDIFRVSLRIYDNCGFEPPEFLEDFRNYLAETSHSKKTTEPATPEKEQASAMGETLPKVIEVPEEQVAVRGTADAVAKRLLEGLIVEQLDEVLLPTDPEKFRDQLKEAIAKTSRGEEALKGKVWEKVIDIATICVEYGGKMYRSKRGGTKQEDLDNPDLTDEERERLRRRKSPPYFVGVFTRPGSRGALAETEEYGYSSKFVDEETINKQNDGHFTWLHALTLDYDEAKRIGVQRIVHARGDNHFGPAQQRKMRAMLEQHGYTQKTR